MAKSTKHQIEVLAKNRDEANLIEKALKENDIRTFVIIVGALSSLPTKRAQQRVLNHAVDFLDEQTEEKQDG